MSWLYPHQRVQLKSNDVMCQNDSSDFHNSNMFLEHLGTNKLAVSCSYEYINLDTGDSREIPMMH